MSESRICPLTGYPCDPSYCDLLSPECLTDYESPFVAALLDDMEMEVSNE